MLASQEGKASFRATAHHNRRHYPHYEEQLGGTELTQHYVKYIISIIGSTTNAELGNQQEENMPKKMLSNKRKVEVLDNPVESLDIAMDTKLDPGYTYPGDCAMAEKKVKPTIPQTALKKPPSHSMQLDFKHYGSNGTPVGNTSLGLFHSDVHTIGMGNVKEYVTVKVVFPSGIKMPSLTELDDLWHDGDFSISFEPRMRMSLQIQIRLPKVAYDDELFWWKFVPTLDNSFTKSNDDDVIMQKVEAIRMRKAMFGEKKELQCLCWYTILLPVSVRPRYTHITHVQGQYGLQILYLHMIAEGPSSVTSVQDSFADSLAKCDYTNPENNYKMT